MNLPERIEILSENQNYKVGDFSFQTSMRHIHPAETYGLKFNLGETSVGLLTDTKFFEELKVFYKTDLLIISVVFFDPRPAIDHLCLADAEEIIKAAKPKKAILTHFGMTMLKAKPHIQAEKMTERLGIEVVAAYDGMSLKF
jgi:ribonuclease BN (tRNA processing enzyme)